MRAPSAALLVALLLGAGLLVPGQAGAHRMKVALTTVTPNARTGFVEVIHRFWLHDAEHALDAVGGIDADLHESPEAVRTFADYVAGRFVLADASGAPLALETLGGEVEGDLLWVYQELPIEQAGRIARVGHGSLQDVWTDHVNQVNVRREGSVRTVYLRHEEGIVALPEGAAAPPAGP